MLNVKRLLAASLLLIGSNVNAGIIYTDIADVTILGGSSVPTYDLDLNNDATADFTLSHGVFMDLMRIASPSTGANKWVQDPVAGRNYPAQLSAGDVIGSSETFVSSDGWNFGLRTLSGAAWTDPVTSEAGGGLGYLGFQFDIAGSTHYGWAQLNFLGSAGGVLIDYAYESTAGQSISAGATSLPVPEPASLALLGLGLAGIGLSRKRKTA